ncbi:hypothetical protein [Burkholderia sp. Bp8963]|nr:hypothetical protein [Burkholderia sp. Bp8963]
MSNADGEIFRPRPYAINPLEQPGLSQMVSAIDAFYRDLTTQASGVSTLR